MTDDRVALIEAFQKADDGNFLRSLAETVLQILMEADVDGLIGAGRYERSGERSTYRNGYPAAVVAPTSCTSPCKRASSWRVLRRSSGRLA